MGGTCWAGRQVLRACPKAYRQPSALRVPSQRNGSVLRRVPTAHEYPSRHRHEGAMGGIVDESVDTEDVWLRGLIELLELGQQFYATAILRTSSDPRKLHERSARCYAAMLAEIRQWQTRNDNSVGRAAGPSAPSALTTGPRRPSPPETYVADDVSALLQRVYRIHRSSLLYHPSSVAGAGECPT